MRAAYINGRGRGRERVGVYLSGYGVGAAHDGVQWRSCLIGQRRAVVIWMDGYSV